MFLFAVSYCVCFPFQRKNLKNCGFSQKTNIWLVPSIFHVVVSSQIAHCDETSRLYVMYEACSLFGDNRVALYNRLLTLLD